MVQQVIAQQMLEPYHTSNVLCKPWKSTFRRKETGKVSDFRLWDVQVRSVVFFINILLTNKLVI